MLGFAIRAAAAAISYAVAGGAGAVLLITSQNPAAEMLVGAWVMLSVFVAGALAAVGFSLSLTNWVRRQTGID
ncbi:MAG: hypothetical protein JSR86_18130 [Proteobacteria bacterium]|nr:hypothetical protein [Pseudomonadota bacterium]